MNESLERFNFSRSVSFLPFFPNQKVWVTLAVLFWYRIGNEIHISGLDQVSFRQSFLQLQNQNAVLQFLNLYSGSGGKTLFSPFSLGIIPFVNASILIDLATSLIPRLEELQSEGGELGKKQLAQLKKFATFIFAIIQSFFLFQYARPYFYQNTILVQWIVISELVIGTMSIVWLSNVIDQKGIGNGTSILIFTNIIVSILNQIRSTGITPSLIEFFFLLILIAVLTISQSARLTLKVVSARQLAFLEKREIKEESFNRRERINPSQIANETGLAIRYNQAGIVPIIIASNLLPFLSFQLERTSIWINIVYSFLIIGFNYFYTSLSWNPEKIAQQLRKASVSLINITPGKETISYLETIVRSTSVLGGIGLCCVLLFYESAKIALGSSFLNQFQISSLIILIGVAYEIQKNLRSFAQSNRFDL